VGSRKTCVAFACSCTMNRHEAYGPSLHLDVFQAIKAQQTLFTWTLLSDRSEIYRTSKCAPRRKGDALRYRLKQQHRACCRWQRPEPGTSSARHKLRARSATREGPSPHRWRDACKQTVQDSASLLAARRANLATTEKAISILREAADAGAELIAFPESYIPAVPVWSAL